MFFFPSSKYHFTNVVFLNFIFFIFISVIVATPLSKEKNETINPNFNDTTAITKEEHASPSTKRWLQFLPWFNLKKCKVEDKTEFIAHLCLYPSLVISKGSDWAIYKWTRPSDNKMMLVKAVNKHNKDLKEAFNREMRMHSKFKGEGITADIDCIFEDFLNYQYYMKPLLKGIPVTADNVFNPASSNINIKWAEMCLQMAKVVDKIHKKGIVQLDLRLANWIMSPEGKLYIQDFSSARSAALFSHWRQCESPETIKNPGCSGVVSDTWMLGKVFSQLFNDMVSILTEYRGFNESNRNDILVAVQEDIDTSWIESIIEGMMNKDPNMRNSITESIVMLNNLEMKWKKTVAK